MFDEHREISRRIRALSEHYDLKVDPQTTVSELAVGEQQKVEILKLLLRQSRPRHAEERQHNNGLNSSHGIHTPIAKFITVMPMMPAKISRSVLRFRCSALSSSRRVVS